MKQVRKKTINLEECLATLTKVSIFSQTDPEILQEIAEAMSELTLKPEQTLFKKGEKGEEMYIIVDGAVRIHDGSYVFAVLRSGQVFGEYSILEPQTEKRSASATAIVITRLLKLEKEVFYELMANRIEIVKGILRVLIKRSRRQNYYEEKLNEQTRQLEKQRDLINQEKEKSERLLLNILPSEIADELKTKGKADVRQYKHVSVLFADIKGFTKAASLMDPSEVLKVLEIYFNAFDEIISQYPIEKIKTMGDAYMCAGGLPSPNKSNAIDLTLAALQMQQFMKEHNQELLAEDKADFPFWELRLGINTGPLIAGVIGRKKFIYDIWGDTVNVASRMESSGEVNKINVSGATYEYLKDFFECESRGKINAKGKGDIEMYFVSRIKKELSEDKAGLKPNQLFYDKMKEAIS